MQCCFNGASFDDVPKNLSKYPTVNDHTVTILSNLDDQSFLITLILQGVTSYLPVSAATLSIYKSDMIPKFHIAAEAPMWGPGSPSYSLQEDSMLDLRDLLSALSQQ